MNRNFLIVVGCLFLLTIGKANAQAPNPEFSATPTSGCGPLGVKFTDQSTGSPLFWDWDFGNGQTSTQQNPSVVYTNPGTYTVTLIVRNRDGSNVIQKTGYITVFPFPAVSFTSNLTVACAPATVQFNDKSSPGQGNITSWTWDFGDGATSSNPNPSHIFAQPGYYDITLTVLNSGGCSNKQTIPRYLRVIDGIQPNFSTDQVSASCIAPFDVNFNNQTAGPGNLSYSWNFGTGVNPSGSSLVNPSGVLFPSAGNFPVTLQVQSSLGCSATFQKTVAFDQYTASFSGPTTICVNSPATFTNTSTPASPGSTWDFGDGGGTTANPATRTYTAFGTYNVKLVNHYPGCTDSITIPVQVTSAPAPDFTADATGACQPNLTVNFSGTATGTATQWLWDFGDGSTGSGQNISHTYTTSGSFDVTLSASGGSCAGTVTKAAFINIKVPTVDIAGAGSLGTCVTTSAPAGSTHAINPLANITSVTPIASYSWNAPGSVQGSSTSATPSFSYASTGLYNISVTVTTADGCTSAPATSSVSIGTPASITAPTFTITDVNNNPLPPAGVCGRDSILLTATPSGPYSYIWNFGDGTRSKPQNQPTIKYAYKKPWVSPPAQISVSVSNSGCPYNSLPVPLVVNYPFPDFSYQVHCSATSLDVTFSDSSKVDGNGSPNYKWNFNDGTGDILNPAHAPISHTYATNGVYHVTLTLSDGACADQSYSKDVILLKINPDFTGNPGTFCKKKTFPLQSISTIFPNIGDPTQYIQSYIWTISPFPPDTTNGPAFNAVADTNGTYNITLTAVDINGCTSSPSAPQTVQITGPTAHFTMPASGGGCKNGPTLFTENSTLDPAAPTTHLTSWSWQFGDSTTSSNGPTVSHDYADTGFYHVSLRVTDNNGCFDNYTSPDSIRITGPVANFGGPDSFYCPGVPLQFIDSSQGHSLHEAWAYGDGGATDSAVHTFATPGQSYSVTLTVTDTFNCISTVSKPVNIQKPFAAFDIADTTGICTPLQTRFTSHSQYYDSLYWDFGDGSTSTLPVTSHFYNTMDTFTAKLYVRGPGGCYDSASRRVLVLDPVALTDLTYSPLKHCDSVNVNFSITVPGYTSFLLGFGDGALDSSGNTTAYHVYRNPNSYDPALQLEDATGCVVLIRGKNTVTVLGAAPFFTVSKRAFCDSGMVTFTDYTISNNGFNTEIYTFGDGSPSQTQDPANGHFNVSNFFNQPGMWQVALKVTTDSGCTETYADTIHVYQTPHPQIALASQPCAGLIQFAGSITAPQVDTISWAWDFGNGQAAKIQNPAVQLDAGNYTVRLKTSTSFGCSDTTSSTITINPIPVISGPKQITTPLGIPVTIPFTYSSGVVGYNWYPAANLDCATCPNPVATLQLSTQYIVTVTDADNCKASDSIFIKTICTTDNIFMPNTFSPNGDGVNDVFYPRGKSLYNVQSLAIFNRWGQMVFQRRDFPANTQDMGWDGNFNGHPAPADAYVYIVEVICQNAQVVAIHGNVTLLR